MPKQQRLSTDKKQQTLLPMRKSRYFSYLESQSHSENGSLQSYLLRQGQVPVDSKVLLDGPVYIP